MTNDLDRWEFYKDKAKHWRWRRTSSNGRIVGSSTQGYARKRDCESNATREGWKEPDASQEGLDPSVEKPKQAHRVSIEASRVSEEGLQVPQAKPS